MKRFLMTVTLTCLLSVSAFAGNIPTVDFAPPAPGNVPTVGVAATIVLTVIGLLRLLARPP